MFGLAPIELLIVSIVAIGILIGIIAMIVARLQKLNNTNRDITGITQLKQENQSPRDQQAALKTTSER